ncbi:MAG: glycosyltransferase family 9 protein [Geobacteraceae bacterium]|nr:glycosyltransferase family 9 protein [Geobacteraceae bacterium]
MESGNNGFKNILIIKPGAIGDLLHLTPVVRALKERFPHAKVTMLVGSRLSTTIFENNPFVHESIVFEKKGAHKSLKGLLGLWKELHARRFDLVLNYQRSNLKGWFLASSAFPCRVLVYHKSRKRLMHAVENHLGPLTALGIDTEKADRKLDFFPSTRDQKRAEEVLDSAAIHGRRIVAFNPGTNHLCKCWPLDRFAELADRVIERMGTEVIILGSPDEKKLADEIQSGMRNKAHDLTGCTLGELGALLKRVEVLITGDTGPMHIAAAVGTPALALYGPISPLRSGPIGDGHRIVIHDELDCCPCNSFKCVNPVFRLCMESITVDEVFAELSQMLDNQANQERRIND